MTTTAIGFFSVIDVETDKVLATLPLTFPIGSTVENFTRAGYTVKWNWA